MFYKNYLLILTSLIMLFFTEKVEASPGGIRRERRNNSGDTNAPSLDFTKQESTDDLSQRTRETNPEFTMDVRRRLTGFDLGKFIALGTRLFHGVFENIEQIHGEEGRY